MQYYLGFDLGGSSLKIGVVTDEAGVVHHEKVPVPDNFEGLMQLMADTYHRLKADWDIRGIGISSCGCIDPENGRVGGWMAPAALFLIGRQYYDLCKLVDVPVRAEKDSCAAALGEIWAGGASDYQNFLTLVLGSGQGGAAFLDGKLYRGAHFFAGDMGYVAPMPEGPGYSALTAPVPYEHRYFEETGKHLSCSDMYVHREEDPVAARLWNEFITNLAHFCVQMQFTFDPQAIFIGGGISGWTPFIPLLQEQIDKELAAWGCDFNRPEVHACSGGNDANLLGAVYGLKQKYGI